MHDVPYLQRHEFTQPHTDGFTARAVSIPESPTTYEIQKKRYILLLVSMPLVSMRSTEREKTVRGRVHPMRSLSPGSGRTRLHGRSGSNRTFQGIFDADKAVVERPSDGCKHEPAQGKHAENAPLGATSSITAAHHVGR